MSPVPLRSCTMSVPARAKLSPGNPQPNGPVSTGRRASRPQPVGPHRAFIHSLERERRQPMRALDRSPWLAPISPAQGARHRAELAAALGLDHDDTPREAIVR